MLRECEHCGSMYDDSDPGKSIKSGDLSLVYPRLLICSRTNGEVRLTRMQSNIMQILMRGVLSSEAVLVNFFPSSESGSDVLRVHISKLRSTLKAIGSRTRIENIKGLGYKLEYHSPNEEVSHEEYIVPVDRYRSVNVRVRRRGPDKRPRKRRNQSAANHMSS